MREIGDAVAAPEPLKHRRSAAANVPSAPLTRSWRHAQNEVPAQPIPAARGRARPPGRLVFEAGVAESIVARCKEVESGARNIETTLNRTLLPELSAAVLGRSALWRAYMASTCQRTK